MTTVVLVEPKIPQNTGTIARLCAATDCKLILVGELGFSLDDKYLKRAGLDYWPHVQWEHIKSTSDYINSLQEESINPWLFSTKGAKTYTNASFSTNETFIFGSETEGLSEEIRTTFSDQCLKIPMKNPNIRSLNLANSVSIIVYEAIRQIEMK